MNNDSFAAFRGLTNETPIKESFSTAGTLCSLSDIVGIRYYRVKVSCITQVESMRVTNKRVT